MCARIYRITVSPPQPEATMSKEELAEIDRDLEAKEVELNEWESWMLEMQIIQWEKIDLPALD